ncbi:uncharacterized protein L969DRAFT_46515 [Mixia osmundae IAM 14324]|uniref:6,7-dimethyl-8-ribityllumazine synthase n=1 Tax=Mixia osmundae (strain CBS 9802 / IAM 14324 / JCM 22182 / KY 12970) TaxID=764103 RepID=G7E693_MIXOS|nr:uncharacterized protein L969DRAFT_46515 [Mixia osmundae IAM 14324]KEI40492.1 hypothetical protein L969DRAFT_46515 [Mixia osmundae IAM 14324]GAA98353.1 hypothetical protein E5Q_05039 [Mixia osmundae IAM 14324]
MADATIKGLTASTEQFDGSDLRVLIVHARWNWTVIEPLVQGAVKSLASQGVKESKTAIMSVSGSFELPSTVQIALSTGRYDVAIAIGVLIKGSTMHFEYIAEATTQALMRVQLDARIPVIFGVLTCLTEEQAQARAGLTPGGHNHGLDWGLAAVEQAVKATRIVGTRSQQAGAATRAI